MTNSRTPHETLKTMPLKATKTKLNQMIQGASLAKQLKIEPKFRQALEHINNNNQELGEKYLVEHLDEHPEDAAAHNALISLYAKTGNRSALFISLIRLASLTRLTHSQEQAFYELSAERQLTIFTPQIIKGLKAILKYDSLNSQSISRNIGSYVLIKYKDCLQNPAPRMQEICNDDLLLSGLESVQFCDPNIEILLTSLRVQILSSTLKNQTIAPESLQLLINLGIQNYLNEYIAYVSDAEKEMLATTIQLLNLQIQESNWTPYDSEALLLLIAMYQCFHDIPIAETLLQFPLKNWPKNLQNIAKFSLFDIEEESRLAKKIPTLTPIKNSVSKEVQEHYEQNPYPRWSTLSTTRMTHLLELMECSIPGISSTLPKSFLNESTPILIAGGGTGRQPISMAMRFPKAKVTAIDISRRSLAYAQIKAVQLGINNIEFFHADILEASKFLGTFDYIECSGVLHHMEDPKLGWQKLLNLLNPGGIMKVALYSESARKDITIERKKIKELKLSPTADNIRLYRKALLNQKQRSPTLTLFRDFFSLSECRDLLFHQHEQCFTWEKIEEHCDFLNLKFLGLLNVLGLQERFFTMFPEETNTQSLEKLSLMEKSAPYTFRAMYQFLVQKP